VRWVDASKNIHIGFNGAESLGVAVPSTVDLENSELALQDYGPTNITSGGLVDGGQFTIVSEDDLPPTLDCIDVPNMPGQCLVFSSEPDGQLDEGLYYVQGGRLNWDGFHLQIGFRFTLD
jgi:hypothetical protein